MDNEKKEDILREFEVSKEYNTFVEIDFINIFEEHSQIWLIAEDLYFDVNDSESIRAFSVDECTHINGDEGYSFTEL